MTMELLKILVEGTQKDGAGGQRKLPLSHHWILARPGRADIRLLRKEPGTALPAHHSFPKHPLGWSGAQFLLRGPFPFRGWRSGALAVIQAQWTRPRALPNPHPSLDRTGCWL